MTKIKKNVEKRFYIYALLNWNFNPFLSIAFLSSVQSGCTVPTYPMASHSGQKPTTAACVYVRRCMEWAGKTQNYTVKPAELDITETIISII